MSTAEVITEFFETTSAHGFSRISVSKGWPRRLLWIGITLAAFSGVSYHFYHLYHQYTSYSKWINVRPVANSFEFPDITFCPTFSFSDKFFDMYKNDKKSFHRFGGGARFWKAVARYKLSLEAYRTNSERSFRAVAFDYDVYKNPQDHVIDCVYQNEKCSFLNFTVYKDPERYLCFTFQPIVRKLRVSGPNGGLKVKLGFYGSKSIFIGSKMGEKTMGYEVSIHAKDTRPAFSEDYTIAQVAAETHIGLNMQKRVALNMPDGTCEVEPKILDLLLVISINPPFEKKKFRYTSNDGYELYKQKLVMKRCGCFYEDWIVDAELIKTKDRIVFCHQVDEDFYKATTNRMMYSYILENATESIERANCYKRNEISIAHTLLSDTKVYESCITVSYETKSFSVLWPIYKNDTEDKLIQNMKDIMAMAAELNYSVDASITTYEKGVWRVGKGEIFPFAYVNIHAESLNSMEHTENLAMSFTEFIANIGGILGLWIGCSVITLCELIYLFLNVGLVLGIPEFLSRKKKENHEVEEGKAENANLKNDKSPDSKAEEETTVMI